MIDGDKIFYKTWNSCDEIDEVIDYLNTLPLTEEQFKKLEEKFNELINSYSGMKEQAWGDDA